MEQNIALSTELPESVFRALQAYLDEHPNASMDDVLATALSLFLLQNGQGDRREISRAYLDGLFGTAA